MPTAGTEAREVTGALTSMRIDELISNLAIGIAEGQMELDRVCMEIAQFMGLAQIEFGKRAGTDEPDLMSLIELGFTPNFYQFVDTILEVRVAVSSQFEEKREYESKRAQMQQQEYQRQSTYEGKRLYGYSYGWWGWRYATRGALEYGGSSSYKSKNLAATTVDARYSSKYNYNVEGSSMIKTKIVPIPPPDVLEEIIRAKIQERKDWEEHQRLTDQVKRILPSLLESAEALQEVVTQLWGSGDHNKAEKLQDDVRSLQTSYEDLTTDHWVIIADEQRRQVTDNAMNTLVSNAQELMNEYFTAELDQVENPDTDNVSNILANMANALPRFITKIGEIKDKVESAPPVTPPSTVPAPPPVEGGEE